jgi:hypothetical protein
VCGCVTYFHKCLLHIGRDTSLRAYFGMSLLIDTKFKSSIDIMSIACLSQKAHVFFIMIVLSISLAVAFAAIAATIPSRQYSKLCFKLFFMGDHVPKNEKEEKERRSRKPWTGFGPRTSTLPRSRQKDYHDYQIRHITRSRA